MTFFLLIENRGSNFSPDTNMITEFDQNTIANMTAALDYVCKTIPPERDSADLRKRIGNEIIRCAQTGKRSVLELQQAGLGVLQADTKAKRGSWFGFRGFLARSGIS
jgi:hypothetical protein